MALSFVPPVALPPEPLLVVLVAGSDPPEPAPWVPFELFWLLQEKTHEPAATNRAIFMNISPAEHLVWNNQLMEAACLRRWRYCPLLSIYI